MHIDINFATASSVRPYEMGDANDVDLLWQCLISGQMDDRALDREMATNPQFRDHILRMERAGIRF